MMVAIIDALPSRNLNTFGKRGVPRTHGTIPTAQKRALILKCVHWYFVEVVARTVLAGGKGLEVDWKASGCPTWHLTESSGTVSA